jgi:hypothetical protein
LARAFTMKSILAGFALLSTISAASALECTFPADMPVKQISGSRLTWRDGTIDTMLSMSRTPAGGVGFGGAVANGGAVYGVVASDGVSSIVGYNSEVLFPLASQGRCTGMSGIAPAPVYALVPSGFGNLLSFEMVNCISSGKNTGVRALRGGVVDLDDGSLSDIIVYRRPMPDGLLYFKLVKRPDVYGFMKEGASVVVFTHTENDNPRGDPDLCE